MERGWESIRLVEGKERKGKKIEGESGEEGVVPGGRRGRIERRE